MDNKELKENSSYQNSLIYITLVLLGLFYAGSLIIARLCYLPYSKSISIPGDMQKAVWSFMIIPCIFAFSGLFLANIINKKLKGATVLMTFICCTFIAMIPYFYTLDSYGVISYFTSSFVFFLVSVSALIIVLDLKRPRKAKHKIPAVIAGILPLLIDLLFIYVLYNYVVRSDIFPRIAISMISPLLSGMAFIYAMIYVFSGLISKENIILRIVSAGLSCCIASFDQLDYRPLRLAFTVLVVLCTALTVYDIIKSFKFKEKIK